MTLRKNLRIKNYRQIGVQKKRSGLISEIEILSNGNILSPGFCRRYMDKCRFLDKDNNPPDWGNEIKVYFTGGFGEEFSFIFFTVLFV